MINTVIFDLDGLVADTEKISYQVYHDYLAQFGYDLTLQQYCEIYCGKTEIAADMDMLYRFKLNTTLEQLFDYLTKGQRRLVDLGVDLKAGAKELLLYLKGNGYKTVLATSSNKDRAISILKKHNVDVLFDEYVTADDVVNGKPNGEVFEKAAKKVNSLPEQCLVLEDSENGILAANNANIDVICVVDMKYPQKQFEDKCLHVYHSLYEVLNYLKEENK